MILRKFDKDDYIQLKAYRSIVLFNTLGKGFEKIIIMRFNYLIEKYQLLFKKHTEGRKFSLIENAIHMILEKIHKA